ncbi:MAG: hypothetical protein NT040_16000 [Bacteroidetes bacterium]|nr:hypothetical protein [Bacteroidota bacterium]
MKTTQKIIVILIFILPLFCVAETKEIPYTLDDRDCIIRTEQKVESVKSEMNARFETTNKQFAAVDQHFESMDRRFDQLFNFLWAIVGIFTAMMVSVFGFAFWDRKLSLAPLKREDQRIVAVLVDFAKTQPKLTEILKNAGLL